MLLKVTVDGVVYDVEVEVEEDTRAPLGAIFMGGGFVPQHAATPASSPHSDGGGEGATAPLAGSVVRVLVTEGQQIGAGDPLVILEAMKMETEVTAPSTGTVGTVLVRVGDSVTGGQVLVTIEAAG